MVMDPWSHSPGGLSTRGIDRIYRRTFRYTQNTDKRHSERSGGRITHSARTGWRMNGSSLRPKHGWTSHPCHPEHFGTRNTNKYQYSSTDYRHTASSRVDNPPVPPGKRILYSVQPLRYSGWMNGSAAAQFVALRFSASHSSLLPVRYETTPSSTVSVSGPE